MNYIHDFVVSSLKCSNCGYTRKFSILKGYVFRVTFCIKCNCERLFLLEEKEKGNNYEKNYN